MGKMSFRVFSKMMYITSRSSLNTHYKKGEMPACLMKTKNFYYCRLLQVANTYGMFNAN